LGYTIGAANSSKRKERGSIENGKLADLLLFGTIGTIQLLLVRSKKRTNDAGWKNCLAGRLKLI
jgi:predicted amidohydrolase YtcJ